VLSKLNHERGKKQEEKEKGKDVPHSGIVGAGKGKRTEAHRHLPTVYVAHKKGNEGRRDPLSIFSRGEALPLSNTAQGRGGMKGEKCERLELSR